jgi:hypothetical protein
MVYAGDIDGLVLQLMCDEPGPWTREEVVREFSEDMEAIDALARLVGRGLAVKVKGGFYAATAAGRYAHRVREEGA